MTPDAALALAGRTDIDALCAEAAALRDAGHGRRVTWSRKVFIPLTQLCRDVCHYCTFAHPPHAGEAPFLDDEAVLSVARAGAAAGCKEALFTLGDRPEARWDVARDWLAARGFASTLDYLRHAAGLVLRETGLLPHLNPGVMAQEELAALRPVSASMGVMLESASERLSARGGPHFGSPDKHPAARLATIAAAGEAAVPFTSGILIGIGETRRERIEALLALRELHARHGHLQEVIVQNFRAKPGTRMAAAPDATLEELRWTIAVARLLLGAEANIQAPPNLSPDGLAALLGAGINDWGGVSAVTPDHVNPERPWPHLDRLRAATEAAGHELVERLAIYPAWAAQPTRWLDPAMRGAVLRQSDATGLAREDGWVTGAGTPPRAVPRHRTPIARLLHAARRGESADADDLLTLFDARGRDLDAVVATADALRAEACGDVVTYAVNRNINYTNLCTYACGFCAFSKGRGHADLRGRPYDLDLEEIARRAEEAWARGATEVCLQGGIHPDYTGATYLAILRAVKEAVPEMHVHAFSPLEITQGARTLGLDLRDYLSRLRDAGLGSLPGTAAEILDDEVRALICPDKLRTDEWFAVMESAHAVGLRSTTTIMFGHAERPVHWVRHLLRLRAQQQRSGGFTEFVPLPFVAAEAPLYRKSLARRGPTWREAVLMHAVARIALHGAIPHIQASWVKLSPDGAAAMLAAGADDLGGTLMNESISRAAGAAHGQELPPAAMERLIRQAGRTPRQRSTLYAEVSATRRAAAAHAAPLQPVVNSPAGKRARIHAESLG
ncbi:5-amino-6-(D-ribitylamino)uracil--L-tyrosine 4-hydroxyphenyl transferase CofH [Falsiroseomonas oryzae]|uniref:5-amino-6-(D-ribitylamino)uracil--L-tyrosine 4-hydroxyphenyl transferase CofH n=1 Tax=Falsiroseomonas oryzae TaxID=2766473 RepID=UPI0022EB42C8|nr:5-amino-6-(D-ribitylamino)uracil--L-tyrosine 4-hydroxyphenyl transferase CofH [Roseomonas sp. MO-31]